MSQSKQVKFILNEWIPALESRDLDAVSKLIDKDFTLTTYPKSINEKEVTGQQWLEQYASIFPLTTSSKVSCINRCSALFTVVKPLPQTIVHSITESPGKVVLHVRILIFQINPAPT